MAYRDPDLEQLFTDSGEREIVELLLAARPAEPKLDPYFRNYLRDRLMAEARRSLPAPVRRSPWQGWTIRPLPAFAAMAAGFLVVVGVLAYFRGQSGPPQQAIRVSAPVANKTDVSVGQPIALKFSGPVDHTAVEESLEIQPATQYTTHWEGQTLVVIPIHQLAASTTYTVKLRPSPAPTPTRPSVQATPAPTPPVPVVVKFLTAPSPPPPVAQPSWVSQNITYLGDTARLAEPDTFGQAAWTSDGQLLVGRPASGASPSLSASASPTASASPSAGAAVAQSSPSLAPAADLWLMDGQGNFVSRVAAQAAGVTTAPVDGRFAFWRPNGDGHYALIVSSVAGSGQGELKVATLGHAPDTAPTWLGGSRLAYADAGAVAVVDLQGNAVQLPAPIHTTGAIAGSPDGHFLAVQGSAGILVYDLAHPDPVFTEQGGSNFVWSTQGDLAFTVQGTGTQLWIQRMQTAAAHLIQTSAAGVAWANLNWSPDGASLLFAAQSQDASGAPVSQAFLINADGTGLHQLGTSQYSSLAWSPKGDAVLFTRRDETGRAALWKASLRLGSLSDADRAQQQALATVKTFMDARLSGDQATAQAQLSAAALAVYQNGTPALMSPTKPKYERWYPVTVQLANPTSFLIGVRIVEANGSQEVAFFEERLTVAQHAQQWTIDGVEASAPVSLAIAGPSVVSVVVQRQEGGNQVIQVRFDSDLATGAVTASSVYVKDDAGTIITPASLTFDQDQHLASLTVKLHHGRTYTLVVTTSVSDVNGRPLSQEYDSPLVISD